MDVIITIGGVLLILIALFLVSCIYAVPVYIFHCIRGAKLKKVADKFKLNYEGNYSFLSLSPLTRGFYAEGGLWMAGQVLKRHKISGTLNNHTVEIYDITANYGIFLPHASTAIGIPSIRTRRTVFRVDGIEHIVYKYILTADKISSILTTL